MSAEVLRLKWHMGALLVTGNTYPMRHDLKEHGFWWSPKSKLWFKKGFPIKTIKTVKKMKRSGLDIRQSGPMEWIWVISGTAETELGRLLE